MSKYLVKGIAFVPVEVEMEVEATSESSAAWNADLLFLGNKERRKNSIVPKSEDFSSAHSFRAYQSIEVKSP